MGYVDEKQLILSFESKRLTVDLRAKNIDDGVYCFSTTLERGFFFWP